MRVIDFMLYTSSPRGEADEARIVVHPPQPSDADYVCLVELNGFGERRSFPTSGVDPLQALLLAGRTLCVIIECNESAGWKLYLNAERTDADSIENWAKYFRPISR